MYWFDGGDTASLSEIVSWFGGVGALVLYTLIPIYERSKVVGPSVEKIELSSVAKAIRFHLWEEPVVDVESYGGIRAEWEPGWDEVRLSGVRWGVECSHISISVESGRTYSFQLEYGRSGEYIYISHGSLPYFRCRRGRDERYCWVRDIALGYLAGAILDPPEGEWPRVVEIWQRLCCLVERVEGGERLRRVAQELKLPLPLVRWSGWHGVAVRSLQVNAYQELVPALSNHFIHASGDERVLDLIISLSQERLPYALIQPLTQQYKFLSQWLSGSLLLSLPSQNSS